MPAAERAGAVAARAFATGQLRNSEFTVSSSADIHKLIRAGDMFGDYLCADCASGTLSIYLTHQTQTNEAEHKLMALPWVSWRARVR